MGQEAQQEMQTRVTVEALYIPRCPHCEDSRVRDGKYVKDICPNCGGKLDDPKDLGYIYDNWKKLANDFKGFTPKGWRKDKE